MTNTTIRALPWCKDSSSSILDRLYYSMNIHQQLVQKHGSHQHLLPPFVYTYINLKKLIDDPSAVWPEPSLDKLFDLISQPAMAASPHLKTMKTSLTRYKTASEKLKALSPSRENSIFCSPVTEHAIQSLDQLHGYLEAHTEPFIPILCIENPGTLSLHYEHVSAMAEQEEWILQLIGFFSLLTDEGLLFDADEVTFDAFLFHQSGHLYAFLAYDLLSYDLRSRSREGIMEHNLRSFFTLMESFYDYYHERVQQQNSIAPLFQHDSLFTRLWNRMKQGVEFNSFAHMMDYCHGKETPKPDEHIGVFLDTANIYTGLRDWHIDFHRLMTSLYGLEQTGRIREKYATVFLPVYDDEEKTRRVQQSPKKRGEELERQGFKITYTSNDQAKAKQWIDGIEVDSDDQQLIKKMEEKLHKLTSVLLLSGDQHFHDILMKYKQANKHVKLISVQEEDTSQMLLSSFGEDHSYITDYWDCMKIHL